MTRTLEEAAAELLPCPFCGGEASIIAIRDGRQASCKGLPRTPCFAKGPAIHHGPDGYNATAANATAAWNTRAALSNPSPLDREAIIRECAAVVNEVMFIYLAHNHTDAADPLGDAKDKILALIEQAGGE